MGEVPPGPNNERDRLEILYREAISMWKHQDKLLWTRVHLLVAIQAVDFAAVFSTNLLRMRITINLLSVVMFFAAILAIPVLYLAWLDVRHRDGHVDLKDRVENILFDQRIREQLRIGPNGFLIRLPRGLGKGYMTLIAIGAFFVLIDFILVIILNR